LGADWLTAAWGQNAALYATSPAASIVETVVGNWLKAVFGLPPSAGFALVTGCQMAHVTCFAAARHHLLHERGWNVETDGLRGAPRIRVISSRRQHASIERAIRMLGLGTNSLTLLESDERETLDANALQAALEADETAPTIVVLQAGDINTGSFDRFSTLIPLAKRYGAWLHVDGAFGLWAAASPRYARLLEGVSEADSWATDGHKWLNVPFDCGFAFVRHADAHRAAMSVSAPYVAANAELRDQLDWNPEWSRRARGFSTYAAIRELGRSGIASLIERTCKHASDIVERLGELPAVEVLWRPIINQGLVRFLDQRPNAIDSDHDRRTEAVIHAIVESGEAFFAATTWRGKRCMRISVLNWRTSSEDVRRTTNAVSRVLEEMQAE
ncbi:MAG: aspartate aminotransferase family protein, partial [Candidatus Eremiobacteraeota bacterium]|nr:aspartate aminotransferase family protein [Candidatus Eremiobacteraeota bacterium]